MSDAPDNLVLELLRALRNDVATLRSEMRDQFADSKTRITAVELGFAAQRRELAGLAEADIHLRIGVDRIADRLDKIERRLEILPA